MYYFFDDMIDIKNLDPSKIEVDEKSYKNTVIYHIGCVTVKDVSYATINNVNLWYIINKINGYIEENNGNKYLTPVLTDESKNTIKMYEERWNTIRDIIRSITNNWEKYEKKYMKIKFNSTDNWPLRKR